MWHDDLTASADHRRLLAQLPATPLKPGAVLFRPGDAAHAFVLVLAGRIDVCLTGASGRGIRLYSVGPGQSCVQTTLGLFGEEPYTGEAVVAEAGEAILIPRATFLHLAEQDATFRRNVLRAFGRRMSDLTHVLEQVAFGRIDSRLIAAILDLRQGLVLRQTQEALAARIGTAREVVTRHLRELASQGLIRTGRGRIDILDLARLEALRDSDL